MLDLNDIARAVRSEGGVSRRLFLSWGAALASLPMLGERATVSARPRFAANPFTLGIASGDPTATGIVLWTRLAPTPLEQFGGMPAETVEVQWELANDESMKEIVQSGKALATPQLAHSVHVEVEGLKPDRWYFYRFRSGDAESAVGRTRTMPPEDSIPAKLRFGFASCSHWEAGHFTNYGHMAKDNLDLAFHLGDYIYEGAHNPKNEKAHRKHHGKKLKSLADYRARHAQYKTDSMLQAAHVSCPWVVTWDDHEFENNYANGISEKLDADPVAFLEQRANAYQAYYENMPLRRNAVPHGPDMKLYRTIRFGRLAAFQVLDTRQYRTDQPNGDKHHDLNEEALSPKNTLLGAKQAGWLKAALLRSNANWNVLAQQVMMGMVDTAAGPERKFSMDQWPGAAWERMKLMEFIGERRIPNPVVLTGDIHSNWANELRVDDRKPETPVIAAEFVGSSISSGGDGMDAGKNQDTLLSENPFVKFHNRQRGYVRCTVTPAEWKSEYQVVDKVTTPDAAAKTRIAFVLESGKAGLKKV